jgi:hypothetical protein
MLTKKKKFTERNLNKLNIRNLMKKGSQKKLNAKIQQNKRTLTKIELNERNFIKMDVENNNNGKKFIIKNYRLGCDNRYLG